MAVRYGDSCDHYDLDTDIALKWTSALGVSSTAAGRNGRGIHGGGDVGKTLDYQAGWIVGWAWFPIGSVFGTGQLYFCRAAGLTLATLVLETDGTLSLYAGNSNTLLANVNADLRLNTWHYLEVKTVFSGTTPITATMTLHVNGIEVIAPVSGSTLSNASDTLLGLSQANNHVFRAAGGNLAANVDDFYILALDGVGKIDFLGDIALSVLFPRADVTADWTAVGGATSTLWDHVNPLFPETNDDTIYIKDNTVADVANFDWQPVAAFSGSIPFVHYGVFNRKDQEGTRTFKQIAQGVPAGDGPTISPGDSYKWDFYAMDQDPATSADWTQVGFNAATFGVKTLS